MPPIKRPDNRDKEGWLDYWYQHDRYHRLRANVGRYTGAPKPPYPVIHRPYGTNTRQLIFGKRDTGLYDNTYHGKNLIGSSEGSTSFIPSNAVLGQGGCPTITRHVPALHPGRSHWLFEGEI